MTDVLTGLLSIILVFFLPGFLLILVIFPKRGTFGQDFDMLFKLALGVALSMLISILTGMMLYGVDQFTASPDIQSTRLWIILSVLSAIFAAVGWWKGGLRELIRGEPSAKTKTGRIEQDLEKLSNRKRELQAKTNELGGEEYKTNESLRKEAEVRTTAMRREIEEIDKKIDKLIAEEGSDQGEKDE